MFSNPKFVVGLIHMKVRDIEVGIVHAWSWALVGHKFGIFVEVSFLTMAVLPRLHFLKFFLDL